LRDTLEKERQNIREDVRKGVEGALERSRASLDRLGGGSPATTAAENSPDPTARKAALEPESTPSKDKSRQP